MADDRLSGTLLGTALGDALGLPAEGMSARAIARRFGTLDRFRLFGRTGYVSDDTEQSALVAECLIRHRDDLPALVRAFRRSLAGWFLRLPFGIGLATLRAGFRILLGLRRSGVASAGNGAAMRAAVIGVALRDDPAARLAIGRALAEVTHTDPRAVDGALFVAELGALCARAAPGTPPAALYPAARSVVTERSLLAALDRAAALAADGGDPLELGTSGFVLHSLPLALYSFLRHQGEPMAAIGQAIAAGGDTDTTAAIVGGWAGALRGESALPAELIGRIHDGPFGPSHLRALAAALSAPGGTTPPRYSALGAFLRNLALYPVILAHGLRRLF